MLSKFGLVDYDKFRPRLKITREQLVDQVVDRVLKDASKKGYKLNMTWNEDSNHVYTLIMKMVNQHNRQFRERYYPYLKPYKKISEDYVAPYSLPKWCRIFYDSVVDWAYNLSSFSIAKWFFFLLLFYFIYLFLFSFFYPLNDVTRKEFLHPRSFVKPSGWFIDENWLNKRTKFVFLLNMTFVVLLIVGFLIYLYEGVLLLQYYDCYFYYQHLYQTVPFFQGGSSRQNGGAHTVITLKKRLRHPTRSARVAYSSYLFVRDRW